MSVRLEITRAQAKALAVVAKEQDCVFEVERNGTIYRVIPEFKRPSKPEKVDQSEDFEF